MLYKHDHQKVYLIIHVHRLVIYASSKFRQLLFMKANTIRFYVFFSNQTGDKYNLTVYRLDLPSVCTVVLGIYPKCMK